MLFFMTLFGVGSYKASYSSPHFPYLSSRLDFSSLACDSTLKKKENISFMIYVKPFNVL